MEKARRQRGPVAALQRLHKQHEQLVTLTSIWLGLVTGVGTLYGWLPSSPAWIWPAVAGVAVVTMLVTLYSALELKRDRDETAKAFNDLVEVTRSLLVAGVEDFARTAEVRQQLPIVECVSFVEALRAAGAKPEAVERMLGLLAHYERQTTGKATH